MRWALAAVLAVLALAAPATAAQPRASLPDIEDEVMCVQCGTALNISESPVADRERAFIREQIAAGKTKAQIKDALVAEYGPQVLAMPPDHGVNLAVYVVPPLALLLAAAGVLVGARRWRRAAGRGGQIAAPAGAAAPPLDPSDAARLDAELAAFDRR